MEKEFDTWNEEKKSLNRNGQNKFYHQRDIWWCVLGINVGFEQDGKGKDFARPVLVIRGFSKEVLLCVPLTTKLKKGKYYHPINLGDGISRMVILSQVRLIDSRRLQEKIATIDEEQFAEIKRAVIQLIQ